MTRIDLFIKHLLLAVLEHWKCESREVPQTFNSWVVCFSVCLSVCLSVCPSVCLSVYKNAIFITRRHRKMSQIYVKYSLYIQSYYFNFTFVRASLWRVQLWNQWCTDRIWITAIYKNQCVLDVLDILFTIREFLFYCVVYGIVFSTTHCQLNTVALVTGSARTLKVWE